MANPNARGRLNVHRKLEEMQVREIRRLASETFSAKEIIDILTLNISQGYCNAVMRGESHHHL
jgi:hypothetical protein